MKWMIGLMLLLPALCVSADTIQLTTGKPFKGKVTRYAESKFEVVTEDGNTTQHQAPFVRRIDFEAGAIAALKMSTGADVKARVSRYERSAFVLVNDKEQAVAVAVQQVIRAEFTIGAVADKAREVPDDLVAKALASLKKQLGTDEFQFNQAPGFVFAGNKIREQTFQDMVQLTTTIADPLWKQYFTKHPSYPLTVYLFKDRDTYAAYAKKLFNEDVSKHNAGLYVGKSRALIATTPQDMSKPNTEQSVYVHELVHALMAPDFPGAPVWFAEGMAALFEQYQTGLDGQFLGAPNARLSTLKRAITEKKNLPLAELLACDEKKFYDDNELVHYAQVRYLCLFLQDKGVLREFYRAFRDGFATDKTGSKAMQKVLKMSLDDIETEWLHYIARCQ